MYHKKGTNNYHTKLLMRFTKFCCISQISKIKLELDKSQEKTIKLKKLPSAEVDWPYEQATSVSG